MHLCHLLQLDREAVETRGHGWAGRVGCEIEGGSRNFPKGKHWALRLHVSPENASVAPDQRKLSGRGDQ